MAGFRERVAVACDRHQSQRGSRERPRRQGGPSAQGRRRDPDDELVEQAVVVEPAGQFAAADDPEALAARRRADLPVHWSDVPTIDARLPSGDILEVAHVRRRPPDAPPVPGAEYSLEGHPVGDASDGPAGEQGSGEVLGDPGDDDLARDPGRGEGQQTGRQPSRHEHARPEGEATPDAGRETRPPPQAQQGRRDHESVGEGVEVQPDQGRTRPTSRNWGGMSCATTGARSWNAAPTRNSVAAAASLHQIPPAPRPPNDLRPPIEQMPRAASSFGPGLISWPGRSNHRSGRREGRSPTGTPAARPTPAPPRHRSGWRAPPRAARTSGTCP